MNLAGKPFFLDAEAQTWVAQTLAGMDTRAKAGQLFFLLGGLYPEGELPRVIETIAPGGMLFRPSAAAAMRARHDRLNSLSPIPLLFAGNLEDGGAGVATDGTLFGNPMQVAATGQVHQAALLGQIAGREGAAVGVHWAFAPVVDVAFNFRNPITSTRTFGSDPEQVRELALAVCEALQREGVAACPKHFPGDGVDDRDHHLHPTVNSLSLTDWEASFGLVYRALIDQGVKTIMAGHLLLPAFSRLLAPGIAEKDLLPASLAPELLQGLLRDRLGFEGLITTDATIMGGFTQLLPRSQAIPRAVAAGCDVLLFPNDLHEDVAFLLKGIADGIVTLERLDEAVTRVLALKASLGLHSKKAAQPPLSEVGSAYHKSLARICANQAVTLVKNIGGLLPLAPSRTPTIRLVVLGDPMLADGSRVDDAFAVGLATRGFEVSLPGDTSGLPPLRPVADHRRAAHLQLYIANHAVESDKTTVRLWWSAPLARDLPRFLADIPVVFISLSSPYHLQDVPRVSTLVNAYSATPATVAAVLERLVGEAPFGGTSPVDPFCGLWDAHL